MYVCVFLVGMFSEGLFSQLFGGDPFGCKSATFLWILIVTPPLSLSPLPLLLHTVPGGRRRRQRAETIGIPLELVFFLLQSSHTHPSLPPPPS